MKVRAGDIEINYELAGDVQPSPEQLAEMEERRGQMMEMMGTGEIEQIADAMAERSCSPGFRDRDPTAFQSYKDVKLRNDPRHYLGIMQAMAQAAASPPDLTQLTCPALIIAGDQDAFMAVEVARSMERAIKDVSLTILPTGHAAAIEAPQDFNQAVREFMKRL